MSETDPMEPAARANDVRVALLSETGPVRLRNEDRCGHRAADARTTLVIVADGVAGYAAGDVASEMAVDVTLRAWDGQSDGLRPEVRLARAVQEANIAIHDRAMVVTELRGMATTVTAVALVDGQLAAAHVGDTRLYLVRDGRALQLTKDHRSGKVALTRCVGRELIVAIDRLSRPLDDGDILVLCTDGLHNLVADTEIARLVAGVTPNEACRALVDAGLAAGTDDNLTVAVIHATGARPARARPAGLGDRLRRLVGTSRAR